MSEALLVSLVPVLITLCGITLSYEVIEPLFFWWKQSLLRDRFREMLLHQFLVFLVTQLVQDSAHIRLSDSPRREQPAGGARTRGDNHATRFEFPKVNIVHYETINRGLSRVLLSHKDLI